MYYWHEDNHKQRYAGKHKQRDAGKLLMHYSTHRWLFKYNRYHTLNGRSESVDTAEIRTRLFAKRFNNIHEQKITAHKSFQHNFMVWIRETL